MTRLKKPAASGGSLIRGKPLIVPLKGPVFKAKDEAETAEAMVEYNRSAEAARTVVLHHRLHTSVSPAAVGQRSPTSLRLELQP